MTGLNRVLVMVAVLAMPMTTVADQSAHIRVRVWPMYAHAPADVRIDAMVEPADVNRALRVTVDNGEFFRSSTIALDGEKAPKYYSVHYRALPEGDFSVQLELIDQHGARRALEHQEIHIFQ